MLTPDIGLPQGQLDPTFNFDKLSRDLAIRFAPIRDSPQRMHHRGMIPPAKPQANFRQAAIGILADQRHGDLARPGQPTRTTGPNHFTDLQMVIAAHDAQNGYRRL